MLTTFASEFFWLQGDWNRKTIIFMQTCPHVETELKMPMYAVSTFPDYMNSVYNIQWWHYHWICIEVSTQHTVWIVYDACKWHNIVSTCGLIYRSILYIPVLKLSQVILVSNAEPVSTLVYNIMWLHEVSPMLMYLVTWNCLSTAILCSWLQKSRLAL